MIQKHSSIFYFIITSLSCALWCTVGQSFTAYHIYDNADSSFFIYGGRILIEGLVLYKDFWDQKPPGVFYINYLIIKFFGQNMFAFAFIYGSLSFCAFLFFYITLIKLIQNHFYSFITTFFCCYAFNLNNYQDFGNRTEFFVAFFELLACACVFIFFKSHSKKALFFSGLCSACAFLFKPIGMASYLALSGYFVIQCVLKEKGFFKSFLISTLGFTTVLFLTFFFLESRGVLYESIYATFIVPIKLSVESPYGIFEIIKLSLIKLGPLWGILIFLVLCLTVPFLNIDKKRRNVFLFALLFSGSSFAGVVVQKYCRPHYYLPVTVPLCMLSMLVLFLNLEKVKLFKIHFMINFILLLSFLFFGKWSLERQFRYLDVLKNLEKNREIEQIVNQVSSKLNDGERIYCFTEGYLIHNLSSTFSPVTLSPLFTPMSHAAAKMVQKDFKPIFENPLLSPFILIDRSFESRYFLKNTQLSESGKEFYRDLLSLIRKKYKSEFSSELFDLYRLK